MKIKALYPYLLQLARSLPKGGLVISFPKVKKGMIPQLAASIWWQKQAFELAGKVFGRRGLMSIHVVKVWKKIVYSI